MSCVFIALRAFEAHSEGVLFTIVACWVCLHTAVLMWPWRLLSGTQMLPMYLSLDICAAALRNKLISERRRAILPTRMQRGQTIAQRRKELICILFRPKPTRALHRCGLLRQMSHVAWSVCMYVYQSVGHTGEPCKNGWIEQVEMRFEGWFVWSQGTMY